MLPWCKGGCCCWKVVFATKILLLQGCCSFNVFVMWKLLLQLLDYYFCYIWKTTHNVIWKTKVKVLLQSFYCCKASFVLKLLLLLWSVYSFEALHCNLQIIIPRTYFVMMNLLWLPCATIILAFDAPCNNDNTTQQEVNKRWREILQHNLMKVQGQKIMKCNVISI
jgi:hypothetical protein